MDRGREEEETGQGGWDLFVFFGLLLRMDWKFLLKTNAGNLIHRPSQKKKNTVNTPKWGMKCWRRKKKIHQEL